MAKDKWQRVEDFSDGFQYKRDVTQLSPGSLILGSKNVVITDGDRVGVRKGSEIFGSGSAAATPIKSCHTFKKRSGDSVKLRTYSDVIEYYNTSSSAWENLNDGYTEDQIFGFADHNVNTDNQDFVYFCNAIEPYTRWIGTFDAIDGALSGGETEVSVQGSVLTDDVFFSGTASSVTTTTVVMPADTWSTDLYAGETGNRYFVYITSGAQVGKISRITACTATQITFDAIAGLSGTPTFEIRKVKYRHNTDLTLRIGTTTATYTGFKDYQTFSGCSNVPSASDGDGITQGIQEYKGKNYPRGNILLVHNTRMFVSGVKGSESSNYYSKIADATDFGYSSPRSADEGGVIDTPEGGGPVTALEVQEDTIYICKEDLIKTLTFTQDANDLPQIYPLIEAPQVGPSRFQGTFKVDNHLFYVTSEGAIKSVATTANYDYVQAKQLSDPIVSFIDDLDFSETAGIYYRQKAYIACKRSTSTFNDVVLVYNFQKSAWEAPFYGINASCFMIDGDDLYYCSSINNETFKMEVDNVYDDDGAPYESTARFAYMNFGAAENEKEFEFLFMEGYIGSNTTIMIKARYDFNGLIQEIEGELSGTEENYIIKKYDFNILGNKVLGTQPLGAIIEEDNTTNLNKFRLYFVTKRIPFHELSIEVSSNEVGARWEILRFATDTTMLPSVSKSLTKALA